MIIITGQDQDLAGAPQGLILSGRLLFVVVQYPLKYSFFPVLLVWISLSNSSSVSCYPSYSACGVCNRSLEKNRTPKSSRGKFLSVDTKFHVQRWFHFHQEPFPKQTARFPVNREVWGCGALELCESHCCPKQHCCFLSSFLPLCFLGLYFLSEVHPFWMAVKCLCRWQEWGSGGTWSHCKLQWI